MGSLVRPVVGSSFLLQEAKKPALADAIWDLIGLDVPADNALDGSQCLGWWRTCSTHPKVPSIYTTSIQSM